MVFADGYAQLRAMKIITITNWIFISLYVLLVIYTLMTANRSGNDAAGRGMEIGFAFLGAFLLAALCGLNILPYRFSRIIALIILSMPVTIGLISGIRHYVELQKQRGDAVAAENGSYYFDDIRIVSTLASAIAAGDVARLKILLQKPQPLINEFAEINHDACSILGLPRPLTAKIRSRLWRVSNC
jgi:hypothetical protein